MTPGVILIHFGLHYKRIEDLGENGGMIHEFGSIYAAIVIQ